MIKETYFFLRKSHRKKWGYAIALRCSQIKKINKSTYFLYCLLLVFSCTRSKVCCTDWISVFQRTRGIVMYICPFSPLVIQGFSVYPFCFYFISALFDAHTFYEDDLRDRSDLPTARSDASTCGCTRKYDKSQWIWARDARDAIRNKSNVQDKRLQFLLCVPFVYPDRWFYNDNCCLLLIIATSCDNCEMESQLDRHNWHRIDSCLSEYLCIYIFIVLMCLNTYDCRTIW